MFVATETWRKTAPLYNFTEFQVLKRKIPESFECTWQWQKPQQHDLHTSPLHITVCFFPIVYSLHFSHVLSYLNLIRRPLKGFVAKDTDLGVSQGYNCLLFAHTRGRETDWSGKRLGFPLHPACPVLTAPPASFHSGHSLPPEKKNIMV